ncbi:MAG: peptide deformylase [Planctomycetes bacterium]|nr:peptide deformylase [Planctomycetota bacterium]
MSDNSGEVDSSCCKLDQLAIICYPDPRLRKRCAPITRFDEDLVALSKRLFELMHADNGVGLAASQVGALVRMFVMNLTGKEEDARVFVNPAIHDAQGNVSSEEGCLSLPDIHVDVRRAAQCRITAQDVRGTPFTLEGEGLVCRVWQHETDHLNGTLLLDRMGPTDRIATRKIVRGLEDAFREKKPARPRVVTAGKRHTDGPVL